MAKADGTSSTINRIWLYDALVLATPAFGGMVLAKKQLTEWLASGRLPWSCVEWKGLDAEDIERLAAGKLPRSCMKGLDAEDIAKAEQQLFRGLIIHIFPSAAYHEFDPKFWRAHPQIDWKENTAWEPVTGGAKASGIQVSRAHLLALLPTGPKRARKRQPGPQMRRVLPALKALYPPNGEVPGDLSTETVRGQVNKKLEEETRIKGLREISWDTMNRILGRA